MPTPFVKENNDSTRVSLFLDVGNVFRNKLCNSAVTNCRQFNTWSLDQPRASTVISFTWRAPVATTVCNLATPPPKTGAQDTARIQLPIVTNICRNA